MGGSSKSQPVPAPAQPLDYAALMRASSEAARAQVDQQFKAQVKYYPEMERLQLGTIGRLRDNLNNDYTQQAKGIIDTTLQQGVTALTDTGNRINQLGGLNMGLAADAYRQAQGSTALDQQIASQGASAMNVRADQVSMPDQIRNVQALNANSESTGAGGLGEQLMASAQSRLASNGQLNAEELRNAGQQASAAYSSRGLGTGAGAAAAEILNRAAFSRQRLNEDSAFAQNVQAQDLARRQNNTQSLNQFALANQGVGMQAQLANQSADQTMNAQRQQAEGMNQAANMSQLAANRDFLMNANTAGINSGITRGNYATSLLGQTANLYGQAGGAYQNAASLGFGGANALVNLDPYQRAMGTGVQLGSGIQGNNGQMIGNTFNQANQMAGNVASFNANMLDSRYNSALNNNAALAGAQSAGNSQLLGAGIGAVGAIGMGAAIF